MHKLTDPQGRSLYLSDREALAMQARLLTPQQLPAQLEQRPSPMPAVLLLAIRLLVVIAVLVVAAILFFFFGQERAEQVRPDITAPQRAQAFRHVN